MSIVRVLVTGSSGFLGHHLMVRGALRDDVEVVGAARRGADFELDLDDVDALHTLPARSGADVVLNAAAMSRIADCERDHARADAHNCAAVAALGRAGVPLLQVSTDLVFDGRSAPYAAVDEPCPTSHYGASKLAGEIAARDRGGCVVRVPLLFGPSFDGTRGATDMLRSAWREGRELTLFTDEFRTPLHAADAADLLLSLCVDRPTPGSVVHLAGPERLSRFEFAERFATKWPAARPSFRPVTSGDPRRPPDVSLRADRPAARSLDDMLCAS